MATITTLIPAYREEYLENVFLGLKNQTYKDFEIIISDDSPDRSISKNIHNGKYSNYTNFLKLKVFEGPGGEIANHNFLIGVWSGSTPFAHINHDDDFIFPTFYEEHLKCHKLYSPGVSVSKRWFCNQSGIPVFSPKIPYEIEASDIKLLNLQPDYITQSILCETQNWLGEYSNCVFSQKILSAFSRIPEHGEPYFGLTDVPLFLLNSKAGNNLGFINQNLSAYRLPENPSYHDPYSLIGSLTRLCWIVYAIYAWKDGFLNLTDMNRSLIKSFSKYLIEMPKNKLLHKMIDVYNSEELSVDSKASFIIQIFRELEIAHMSSKNNPI